MRGDNWLIMSLLMLNLTCHQALSVNQTPRYKVKHFDGDTYMNDKVVRSKRYQGQDLYCEGGEPTKCQPTLALLAGHKVEDSSEGETEREEGRVGREGEQLARDNWTEPF